MNESFIVETITTVGFPIAVCIYLLYERDKTTKAMIAALHKLELVLRGRNER